MSSAKRYLLIALSFALALTVFAAFTPRVVHAITATLVRNVDNPDAAPFSGQLQFDFTHLNEQRLLTTVPAGKRLVIDHISYESGASTGDELVFAALRTGQLGPMALILQVNPPHAAATAGFTLQDGSQPVKTYFEAGQEVWLTASHNTGTLSRDFTMTVTGHYVTL